MRSRRFGALALLLGQFACAAPLRQVAPRDVNGLPGRVVVTRRDGTAVTVHQPRIVFDTLFTGWEPDGVTFVGFPISEIQSVAIRGSGVGRTMLAVGLAVGVAVVAVVALSGHTPDTQIIEDDFAPRLPARIP